MKKVLIISSAIYLSGLVLAYKMGENDTRKFNKYLQRRFPDNSILDYSLKDQIFNLELSFLSWFTVAAYAIDYFADPYNLNRLNDKPAMF